MMCTEVKVWLHVFLTSARHASGRSVVCPAEWPPSTSGVPVITISPYPVDWGPIPTSIYNFSWKDYKENCLLLELSIDGREKLKCNAGLPNMMMLVDASGTVYGPFAACCDTVMNRVE
jgi:hypothetical protein